MSERIRERFAEGLQRIDERLADLDAQIARVATQEWPDVLRSSFATSKFGGACRRILGDCVIEKLCLLAVRDAHDAALDLELKEESKRLEYDERVEKPKREKEAAERESKRKQEEEDQRIREAIRRVKEKGRDASAVDVALLRRNSRYSDRYTMAGDVEQLLFKHGLLFDH